MTLSDVTVVDARKPLQLVITASDIGKSIKNDPRHCAAAVACQRITGADEVRIHKTMAYVKVGSKWTRYCVPPSVYREIVAFDRGAAFMPGTYSLTPPGPSKKLGAQGGSRDTTVGRKHGNKNIRPQHVTLNVRANAPKGDILYTDLA